MIKNAPKIKKYRKIQKKVSSLNYIMILECIALKDQKNNAICIEIQALLITQCCC